MVASTQSAGRVLRPRAGAVRKRTTPVRQSGGKVATAGSAGQMPQFGAALWLGFIGTLALAFISAIGVVHTSHESRMRLYALQQLEQERNRLQVEWGRLLLEQSSLVSQGRIEARAMAELGMKQPGSGSVVIVRKP